jgi:hypothetical protein
MSDMPILPNPFKILDLERKKRIKATDNKCNKCDDTKKEGFNNLKKDNPIIEGMTTTSQNWWFIGTLSMLSIVILVMCVKLHLPYESLNYSKPNNVGRKNIRYLGLFITFAFTSLLLHTNNFTLPGKFINNAFLRGGWEIEDKFTVINKKLFLPWLWIPIIVGFIMFGSLFLPALVGYFENTVGHFICWIFTLQHGGLNKWMRSDNFEALTMYNDEVTTNFNPLMSLFNLENYDSIIDKDVRIDNMNKDDNNNKSDFFVSLDHKDGKKTLEDFKKYIYNNVIIKRVSGEVTLLVITSLISAGILKSVYN